MRLKGQLIQVGNLSAVQRNAMFALMELYYENCEREKFDADLEEKQWVILMHDSNEDAVHGFSTQKIIKVKREGKPVRALFSGDTIVDQKYWAHNPLAQIWGQFAHSLIDRYGDAPLYWFLITKGYKTYRFLPLFFHEYYPRTTIPTPEKYAGLIDTIGGQLYPESYHAQSQVVEADLLACALRPHVAQVTSQRLRDPHIQFFVEANPGHAKGDELCCIAPLTRENFTPAAYRVIGSKQTRSMDCS